MSDIYTFQQKDLQTDKEHGNEGEVKLKGDINI